MLKRLNSPQNLRLNFARITRRCAHKKSRLNGAWEQAISTPKRALIPCRRNLSTRNSKQTVFNSFAPVVRACFRRASSRNPNKAPRPDPTDLSLPLNTLMEVQAITRCLSFTALKSELEIAGFDHERSSCLRRRAIRSQISLILRRRARWESVQTSGEHRVRVELSRWSYISGSTAATLVCRSAVNWIKSHRPSQRQICSKLELRHRQSIKHHRRCSAKSYSTVSMTISSKFQVLSMINRFSSATKP